MRTRVEDKNLVLEADRVREGVRCLCGQRCRVWVVRVHQSGGGTSVETSLLEPHVRPEDHVYCNETTWRYRDE